MVEAKQRGDAEIDKLFKTDEQHDAFFIESESRNLAATQKILAAAPYKLDVSINTISRWLRKVRTEKADDKFRELLVEIKDDATKAGQLAREVGDAHQLAEANVTMLSQALFRARRSDDPKALRSSAVLLSMVMEAVAKQNASRASVISAETSRDRFQFDAAKAALAAAADLQDIQKSKGSEKEKVDRAINRLFGTKPQNLRSSAKSADKKVFESAA